MSLTIQDLMSKMPEAYQPEKAPDLEAVIQFRFSGADAGDWYVEVKDGKLATVSGQHPDPQMSLAADSEDFIKLVRGELDPMQAFMLGKIKISGDMSLALKLLSIVNAR